MQYKWDEEKNIKLKKQRNISFDEIMAVLERDSILDVRWHPNKDKYQNQFLLYVKFNKYV